MAGARARDLGVRIGTGSPGPRNALTDVGDVRVGHCTLVSGSGPLDVGNGPVRTGVTVILPQGEATWEHQLFAGFATLNGNGEVTGTAWVGDGGTLTSPVGLTNTHSVGAVRDALVQAEIERRGADELFWSLPVVAETWDGILNDCNGRHVTEAHVRAALADAQSVSGEAVVEGNVGGGTGMICHGFKGGIGTASRWCPQVTPSTQSVWSCRPTTGSGNDSSSTRYRSGS